MSNPKAKNRTSRKTNRKSERSVETNLWHFWLDIRRCAIWDRLSSPRIKFTIKVQWNSVIKNSVLTITRLHRTNFSVPCHHLTTQIYRVYREHIGPVPSCSLWPSLALYGGSTKKAGPFHQFRKWPFPFVKWSSFWELQRIKEHKIGWNLICSL